MATKSALLSEIGLWPTILIVQGSFQTPLVYSQLVGSLTSKGYSVIHPLLPSVSSTEDVRFPEVTLTDDAIAVQARLKQLIEDEGKTVVVVMHSYGGLVGSESVLESMSCMERRKSGLPGGVIHLFYFSAFMLAEGQSVLEVFGEAPSNDVKPDGTIYITEGAHRLYNDLPKEEALIWESRLVAHAHAVEYTKLTRAAYRYIASTYLICENDQAVPASYQEIFAKMANSTTLRCSAGHSPMLSQPDMLAEIIGQVAEKAVAEIKE